MAILWVHELPGGRDGEWESTGKVAFNRKWKVRVDKQVVGPIAVKAQMDTIAPLFSFYESPDAEADFASLAGRVKIEQDGDNPNYYNVSISYSTDNIPEEDGAANPLTRRPKIECGFKQYTRIMVKDYSDPPKDVVNSAGDAFNPPLEKDDDRRFLTYSRVEASYDPVKMDTFKGAINDDVFFGSPVGTVKCASIRCSDFWERNVRYWEYTYEFDFKRQDEVWLEDVVDQGFHEISVGSWGFPLRVRLLDPFNNPYQEAQPLNGAGVKLAVGAPLVYLSFQKYPFAHFATLGLLDPS